MSTRPAFAAVSLLLIFADGAAAQQAAAPDVQIVTTKVTENFYAIEGQGGRIGVLTGPDGIFMVDSQFPQVAERITAAIRQLSPAPIRFLVNTHVHGDHTGGNEAFASLGAIIMGRPMLRQRLLKPTPAAAPAAAGPAQPGNPAPAAATPAPASGNAPPAAAGQAPAAPAALPVLIFDTRSTVHMNGEGIELIPLPLAHTDGDTAVRFPAADILMTGDVFRSVGYPNIDRANGGSLTGLLTAFDTLLSVVTVNTKVLPGHGPITNRAAIAAHKDMVMAIRDRVARLMKQGQNQAQIIAARITADYDTSTGNAAGSADRLVGQLYAELGGK